MVGAADAGEVGRGRQRAERDGLARPERRATDADDGQLRPVSVGGSHREGVADLGDAVGDEHLAVAGRLAAARRRDDVDAVVGQVAPDEREQGAAEGFGTDVDDDFSQRVFDAGHRLGG